MGGGGGGTVVEFPGGRRVDAAQCWQVTFISLLHFTFILHCKMYIVIHYIRMVVELVLMAIVMTTTAPEELSYVRLWCRASFFASTELFVKFKSAVPGNREIYDAFSYLFSCSMAPDALV